MINVGIVGAGYWGKNLIRNFYADNRVRKLMICDTNKETLEQVSLNFPETEQFSHIDHLLSEPETDAIVISSPPGTHAEYAKKALERGLHVLVEKPFALSVKDASEMVQLAREKQRVLMADHTFLYNNIVEEVRRIVQEGELGEIYYMYSRRLNLGIIRKDVNVIWNLAPHDISIANYILDQLPHKVSATAHCYIQKNITDVAYITLVYKNGTSLHIHDSWLDPLKVRDMVIVGSKKMLIYDDVNPDRHIQIFDKSVDKKSFEIKKFADHLAIIRNGELRIPNVRLQEPLARLTDHFITCIETGETPKTDGIHASNILAVIEAVESSLKNNSMTVEINYPYA